MCVLGCVRVWYVFFGGVALCMCILVFCVFVAGRILGFYGLFVWVVLVGEVWYVCVCAPLCSLDSARGALFFRLFWVVGCSSPLYQFVLWVALAFARSGAAFSVGAPPLVLLFLVVLQVWALGSLGGVSRCCLVWTVKDDNGVTFREFYPSP